MRLVTGTVPPRVNQDKLVVRLERVHISQLVPALHAIKPPMLEHQWWPLTFHLIMDADALIGGIGHGRLLLLMPLAQPEALLQHGSRRKAEQRLKRTFSLEKCL
jgi:hypothetical protein